MPETELSPVNPPCGVPLRQRIMNFLPAFNVGVSWSSNLILMLGSFVVTPAILNALGKNHYGVWLLIASFIGQMKILDLGMTAGCMKYASGAYERGDAKQLQTVYQTSILVFTVTSLLAAIMTLLMTFFLPAVYPELQGLELTIFTLGAGLVVDFFFKPIASNLRARSLFFVYDNIETVTYSVFKLGLVLYFAHRGLSLEMLATLSLAESLVRNAAVLAVTVRCCRWTRLPDPRLADRAVFKLLVGYSSAVFLISIADLVRFQLDAAIIGYFLPNGTEEISVYGIGLRLLGIATASIGVIGAVLIPRFSGLSERGEREKLLSLLRKANLATGLFTVFALVNIAVFGLAFLKLWINKPWVDESYIILMIAIPGQVMSLLTGPASAVLSGMARLRGQTAITILEALCNAALSIALVGPLGVNGVILGTSIPMVIFRGIIFPWVLQRDAGISIGQYYRMHAPALLIGVVYAALIAAFAFIEYANIVDFALACGASTAIFLILVWCLLPQAREAAWAFLAKRRAKAG